MEQRYNRFIKIIWMFSKINQWRLWWYERKL